jgi:hypothetical protein
VWKTILKIVATRLLKPNKKSLDVKRVREYEKKILKIVFIYRLINTNHKVD